VYLVLPDQQIRDSSRIVEITRKEIWGQAGYQTRTEFERWERQDQNYPNQTADENKRGDVYWYKFMWQGKVVRESTKQGNDKVALQMEAAHRTSLAKGEVGIRDKKPSPSLTEFTNTRFEPWAKATFEENARKSWLWYRTGIRSLLSSKQLAGSALDEITGETASEFASLRLSKKLQISTVNGSLRVLRSILHRAVEWGSVAEGSEN